MPINKSDVEFFKIAEKIMAAEMSKLTASPTIENIRGIGKLLKKYVSKDELLPFQEIFLPSLEETEPLRVRFISKGDHKKPLVIFFPGTAFIYQVFDENYSVFSRMMKKIDAHGLMLEYRLSPENPYPSAHEDAKKMLQYVINNQAKLNIDIDKVIICGFSSGANMAAVLCHSLQSNKEFTPFHQYLLSGGYDYTDSLHDYDEFDNEDKMLDESSQKMSFDLYCQNADRNAPNCSPYWNKDFSNLCPTTIQCSEYDGGRSQSEAYAKKLKEHGVELTKIIVPGQSHLTIIYRDACSDGEDPALIAANRMDQLLSTKS